MNLEAKKEIVDAVKKIKEKYRLSNYSVYNIIEEITASYIVKAMEK